MLIQVAQDTYYGLRLMRKNLLLTTAIVLTLALGIGANSLVFSVVRAVILRPLAYPNSNRLVQLWESSKLPGGEGDWVSFPNFRDWSRQAQSFTGIGAYTYYGTILSGDKEAEPVLALETAGKFFDALGTSPAIGRTFLDGEDQPGRDAVVVISHSLWLRRYAGDTNITGHKVDIGGRPHTIVGVMPASFRFPNDLPDGTRLVPIDAWVAGSRRPDLEQRGSHNFWTVARLKPGVSLQQAQAEMNGIADQIAREHPRSNKDMGVSVAYLQDHLTRDARPALLMLLACVSLLLVLACANIANLLLSHAESRRREMAIREAIGAGRMRLIRQTLTESVVLALVGAAVGLGVVYIGLEPLLKWAPADIPRIHQTSIDLPVLLFTAAIALAAGILFGLAPAIIGTASNVHEALKRSAARSSTDRAIIVRRVLIAGQIALAVVLLTGAGLLIRSLMNVTNLNPGFRPDHLFSAFFNLTGQPGYSEPSQQAAFFKEMLRRVRSVPGVESAALSDSVPFTGINDQGDFLVEGIPEPLPGQNGPEGNRPKVSPGYFEAMRIPLIQGRLFDEHDGADSANVAIISELAARTYWPNQNPLGKRLGYHGAKGQAVWHEIVGVVGSTRHFGMEARQKPEIYLPYEQLPGPFMMIVVRTKGDMDAVIRACREGIASLDPRQAGFAILNIEESLAGSGAQRRFQTSLLLAFAALAVFLAAVGIYAVVAYTVTQRGREIGIRLALGAHPHNVVSMIARQGMLTIAAGALVGTLAAVALSKTLGSLLFGVSPWDVPTFATVLALVVFVGFIATFVPARRASRVDPVVALSEE